MTDICADCGKPIGMNEGSYYRKDGYADLGHAFHSTCGDPLGIKAKDSEIERLRAEVAWLTKELNKWAPTAPIWSAERCLAVDRSNIPATCDWPRCCGGEIDGDDEGPLA